MTRHFILGPGASTVSADTLSEKFSIKLAEKFVSIVEIGLEVHIPNGGLFNNTTAVDQRNLR
jgi:hypothetical protein